MFFVSLQYNMATTSDVSKGKYIRYNGEICKITDWQHRTPGKGVACYQAKMKRVKDGKIAENRFRSGESVELVRVETRELQYLYEEGTAFVCMNMESFEQTNIEKDLFDSGTQFMREGDMVNISFDGEIPLGAEAPAFVVLEITYSEPGIKGDTATNTYKPATLETGAEVMVPLFVDTAEKIRIDTRTGEYVERVKS